MKCAACAREVGRHECTGDSGLYGHGRSVKYMLCEDCFLAEDAMINETGTNNHPDVLALYERNQPGGYR